MTMMLNVTATTDRDGWTAYIVVNGIALPVAHADFNGLDDLRYYAKREGYEGILIGAPSVDWGRITKRERSFGEIDWTEHVVREECEGCKRYGSGACCALGVDDVECANK
jgi:hypothetical protein